MRLINGILAILFLVGTLAVRTGHASYPYSGFSIQIYSGGPRYYPPPRHHYHYHYYYPRHWHGHGHFKHGHGHFGFPRSDYYSSPPRYRYGYYPPGLNVNWRNYRCD